MTNQLETQENWCCGFNPSPKTREQEELMVSIPILWQKKNNLQLKQRGEGMSSC